MHPYTSLGHCHYLSIMSIHGTHEYPLDTPLLPMLKPRHQRWRPPGASISLRRNHKNQHLLLSLTQGALPGLTTGAETSETHGEILGTQVK